MLYSPLTTFHKSNEFPIASGAVVTEAGQAWVFALQNGRSVVQPSTGAANEVFAGFTSLQTNMAPFIPTTYVKVETLVVPTSGLLTLARTPVTGTVVITNANTNATVTLGTLSGNTVIAGTVTGGVSNAAAQTVNVTYTYALSVAEATALVGNIQPGGFIGNLVGQVGLGQEGVVYTNQFDTAINWATTTSITLGAGGKLTTGGNVVLKAVVKQAPSVGYPFLGLQFSSEI